MKIIQRYNFTNKCPYIAEVRQVIIINAIKLTTSKACCSPFDKPRSRSSKLSVIYAAAIPIRKVLIYGLSESSPIDGLVISAQRMHEINPRSTTHPCDDIDDEISFGNSFNIKIITGNNIKSKLDKN
jgi:hypothetical protein